MTLSSFTSARADLAAAIAVALPTYTVFDHPSDRVDGATIVVVPNEVRRMSASRWVREITVLIFARRDPIADAMDRLDAALLAVYGAGLALEGVASPTDLGPTEPRVIEMQGIEYLAQAIPLEMEVSE